jgi:thiosulfate/3-mercaptopyruvate sulfurtransferase
MLDAYARPEMLVETEWLAEHLSDPDLRIVDADYPASYARAHIPGAVGHVSQNIYLKTADGETFLMGPEQFAETMAKMGIGDRSAVVVYDSHTSLYAARFWWALTYYGHTNVRVLNGGWHKWLLEGRPATMDAASAVAATFTPRADPAIVADCDLIRGAIGRDDAVILDVRTPGEWSGANDRGNSRRGHVPGAVHLEWTNFMTDDSRKVFKPAAELRDMLRARGVTPDKNVYTY